MFVRVTDCEADVPPTGTLPKDRLVAESDAVGRPPVPLTEMVCGEGLALSVIVMVAVSGPSTVGAKCPWIEQFAPTAREDPQLFAKS